jgi:hypothetical protein
VTITATAGDTFTPAKLKLGPGQLRR